MQFSVFFYHLLALQKSVGHELPGSDGHCVILQEKALNKTKQ